MSITATGNSLHDVQQQIYAQRGDDWLRINPLPGKDYGHIPQLGFLVEWKKGNESFRKEVTTEKALHKLITPLIRDYTLWATFQISAHEAERKRKAKAVVDAARKSLKDAEKAARQRD